MRATEPNHLIRLVCWNGVDGANSPLSLQVAIQACAADAQHLRGADAIAGTKIEDPFDVISANLVEGKGPP